MNLSIFEMARAAWDSFISAAIRTPLDVAVYVLVAAGIAAAFEAFRRGVVERGLNLDPPPYSPGCHAMVWLAFVATVGGWVFFSAYRSAVPTFQASQRAALAALLPDTRTIPHDGGWRLATFAKASNEVRQRGLEDYRPLEEANRTDSWMPVTKADTCRLVAEIYIQEVEQWIRTGDLEPSFATWRHWLDQRPFDLPSSVALIPPSMGQMSSDFNSAPFLRESLQRTLAEAGQRINDRLARAAGGSGWLFLIPGLCLQILALYLAGKGALRDILTGF